MAHYTLGDPRPPVICRGVAQTRRLSVFQDSATSEYTTISGTYTLTAPDGTAVASAVAVSSAATASFTPSSSIAPGSGYIETWEVTVGGVPRVWRIPAIVQSWTLADDEMLVCHAQVLAAYPGMVEYPSGTTSWEGSCDLATMQTLTDYARLVSLRGRESLDRSGLTLLALDYACHLIHRVMARGGNAAALELSDRHLAAYRDGWRNLGLEVDTDGDGDPDTTGRATTEPGFPGPGPLG